MDIKRLDFSSSKLASTDKAIVTYSTYSNPNYYDYSNTFKMISKLCNLILLAGVACAAVLPTRTVVERSTAAEILLQIAPSSSSCANAPYPSECATNVDAAPYLIAAFENYKITNPSEIAAVLALMAYETGEFKYNINHSANTPGQGTRNMQMITYNYEYANSFPALQSQVAAIATSSSSLSSTQANAVRALVLGPDYEWGSGAWFLASQCASIRPTLQAGGLAGFTAYMSCVGVSPSEGDRLTYWDRAAAAFGVSSS